MTGKCHGNFKATQVELYMDTVKFRIEVLKTSRVKKKTRLKGDMGIIEGVMSSF